MDTITSFQVHYEFTFQMGKLHYLLVVSAMALYAAPVPTFHKDI